MKKSELLVFVLWATTLDHAALGLQVAVTHVQLPLHRLMVARSESGREIANGEFSQVVRGKEVTMQLTYKFVDGSIDDESTTYTQQGTFRLVRYQHRQKGPFFPRPVDFSLEAATGMLTSRTIDKEGKLHSESKHLDLPDNLANGFVGTLLLNVPHDTKPFRVGMLVPVAGGRLIRLLVSPEHEQTIQLFGQTLKAAVFRIHPELGGVVGMIARLVGLQPKDVVVWVLEEEEPSVLLVIGQLGGYGPVVISDLVGNDLGR